MFIKLEEPVQIKEEVIEEFECDPYVDEQQPIFKCEEQEDVLSLLDVAPKSPLSTPLQTLSGGQVYVHNGLVACQDMSVTELSEEKSESKEEDDCDRLPNSLMEEREVSPTTSVCRSDKQEKHKRGIKKSLRSSNNTLRIKNEPNPELREKNVLLSAFRRGSDPQGLTPFATIERYIKVEVDSPCYDDKHAIKRRVIKHTGGRRIFTCGICSYRTHNKRVYLNHVTIHSGQKPIKCEICEFKTNHSSNLKRHMKNHDSEKPFNCEICPFSTHTHSKLRMHLMVHTGEKPFKCLMCPHSTNRKNALKIHIAALHTKEKPFKCEMCSYCGTQKASLQKHIALVHTGEKPFKCEICPFRACRQGDLKWHSKVHSEEKPFKCDLCLYSAKRKSNLTAHLVTHSEGKPYHCPNCSYRSATRSVLKRHVKTHTGERRFKCNLCNYSVSRKCSLSAHNRLYHSVGAE